MIGAQVIVHSCIFAVMIRRICLILIISLSAVALRAQEADPVAEDPMPVDEKLVLADSLFKAKRYTQSFDLYESILREDRKSSPAMLLKMAYIREGLNNPADALYYLNLYYLKTSDKDVLEKMEKLAGDKGLRGYEFNDFEFFKTIFYRYYQYLIIFLFALALLLLALAYHQKFKKHNRPVLPAAGMVVVLILLFYTLNFGLKYDRGIIMEDRTYLMQGPSAGAEVLTIVNKGHRLEIDGEEDVWIRTKWDNRTVYVKNNKLRPITF